MRKLGARFRRSEGRAVVVGRGTELSSNDEGRRVQISMA